MRSFTFGEVDRATFDDFSAHYPQGNFQQTTGMGDVHAKEGAEVSYQGVWEDGRLVAATQLEIHHTKLSTFAEVHNGPLVDFHDRELLDFFFDGLKRLAHDGGAAQLEITPDKPYEVRDSDGDPLPEPGSGQGWPAGVPAGSPVGPDTESFDNIVGYGFQHSGFDRQYTAVPRWRYVKDLSGFGNADELLASYSKNTRRNVRIADESAVRVERISREDLPVFHHQCELSCEKQGFENRPLEYFEWIYDCLGENAEFLVAFIDSRAYLKSWEDKRDGFAAQIEHYQEVLKTAKTPEKIQRKLKDVTSKHEASLRRVEQAHAYLEEDGERIPAAAALFVWHANECVYLFSGSDPKYAKFYAASAIQHRIMSECVERGMGRYNFYGINGVFDDPKDPGRGLLEFKQGFNGYVLEMPGSFSLPVRKVRYAAKQLAHKVLGR